MQSRRGSLLEAGLNIGTGFLISWMVTPPILHLFGYSTSVSKAFGITIFYTVISFIRSYIWRRIFNRRLREKNYYK